MDVVLFIRAKKAELALLSCETRHCAVLDWFCSSTVCSSTVCGTEWMSCYLDTLNEDDKKKVKKNEGQNVFKFGGGEKLKSLHSYEIPAVTADKQVVLKTYVVSSDLPLLLSQPAMKKMGSVVVRVSANRLQPAGNTHGVSDSDLQNDQCIKHEAQEQDGCDHGDSQGKKARWHKT